MFGYLREARSSAILCMLFPAVILFLPMCWVRLPRMYLDLLRLPRRTFARTTTIPCFALYPSDRALSIRVGRLTFVNEPSLLHSWSLSHLRSCTYVLSGSFQASLIYPYNDLDNFITSSILVSRFSPFRSHIPTGFGPVNETSGTTHLI